MSLVALSELLGATVRDATGTVRGRVREIAVAPQDHPTRIAFLIVRTADGERVVPVESLKAAGAAVRAHTEAAAWDKYTPSDGVLLLKRDLLDQQIIDVHGRKVVRVNDVELDSTPINSHVLLNVVAVDSDRLYFPSQSHELAQALPGDVDVHVIQAPIGHDGFLTEIGQLGGRLRSSFLV